VQEVGKIDETCFGVSELGEVKSLEGASDGDCLGGVEVGGDGGGFGEEVRDGFGETREEGGRTGEEDLLVGKRERGKEKSDFVVLRDTKQSSPRMTKGETRRVEEKEREREKRRLTSSI